MKRKLKYGKRYANGGYNPEGDAIAGVGNAAAEVALNAALPGAGIAYGIMTKLSDSATTNADGTYKSTGAAVANYISNPLAFVGDVATGDVGNIKAKNAKEELKQKGLRQNFTDAENRLDSTLADGYSQYGYDYANVRKYGGYLRKYGKGAVINPQYEVEGQEVVEGNNVSLENQENLSSDMTLAKGASHEQGGVEGEGGERVYSNRLKTTPFIKTLLKNYGVNVDKAKTIAKAAEKIGKQEGKMEELAKSQDHVEAKTAKLMLDKFSKAKDVLFTEQQILNGDEGSYMKKYGGRLKKYAYGGDPKKRSPLFVDNGEDDNQTKLDYVLEDPVRNQGGQQTGGSMGSEGSGGFDASVNSVESSSMPDEERKDYSGMIGYGVNALNYFANMSDINKVKTDFTPTYTTPAYKRYVDRSGLGINNNATAARTAVNGLRYASYRNRSAALSNILGQTLNANNQVINNENLRRDSILGSNVDTTNSFNVANNNIRNNSELDNMNRRNELIATKTQARNAALDGAMKQSEMIRNTNYANDKMRADTEASQAEIKLAIMSNQNGVADRLAAKYGIDSKNTEEIADRFIKEELSFNNRRYKRKF